MAEERGVAAWLRGGGRADRPEHEASRILVCVNSALSGISVERRRRSAATLGLISVLFVTVGIVALTGTTPGVVRVFSSVSLGIAALLALMAWGLAHSVKLDVAEQRLDAAIDAAVKQLGGSALACGCGHDHDPDEMHVSDAASCAHDGSGTDCAHNCDTCALQALRPSPTTPRSQRRTH
jgi:hypothetical protein